MTKMRLQKFLAAAGLGSRRSCEDLIRSGRISIDNVPATVLGTVVDPDKQTVTFDGVKVELPKKVYILVNKPVGYVCSSRRDRSDRSLVTDLVETGGGFGGRAGGARLFCVGRLDVDSKGAIILSNDGDFSNTVCHPRYDVPKTYRVRVRGRVEARDLEKLRTGIWTSEGKTSATEVKKIRSTRTETILRITLREGKNRIIRRVMAKMGLKVTELERIRIGPVALGSLKPGSWRKLNKPEISKLLAAGKGRPRRR